MPPSSLAVLWLYRSAAMPEHIMLYPVRSDEDPGAATAIVPCECGRVADMVRDDRISTCTTEYSPRCLAGKSLKVS